MPGDILLFTRGLTITEDGFKNTFVHEVQHVADLSPRLAIATNADEQFHTEVNKFANPESLNLINSDRLMNLNLEVRKLNKSMTLAEVNSTNFTTLLTQLEVFDWVFLDDRTMSKPFWEALKAAAPGFLHTGVGALLKEGKKKPVSAADVNKALSGK